MCECFDFTIQFGLAALGVTARTTVVDSQGKPQSLAVRGKSRAAALDGLVTKVAEKGFIGLRWHAPEVAMKGTIGARQRS